MTTDAFTMAGPVATAGDARFGVSGASAYGFPRATRPEGYAHAEPAVAHQSIKWTMGTACVPATTLMVFDRTNAPSRSSPERSP